MGSQAEGNRESIGPYRNKRGSLNIIYQDINWPGDFKATQYKLIRSQEGY